MVDPFLLLDEMGPVGWEPGKAIGAPDHPHRGFETVTYVLAGGVEHRDSSGHHGVLGPGDVQWMTAGRGVVHSEMPTESLKNDGGLMHGFQIWVNLPKSDKMMAPRYQEIPRAEIPRAESENGLAVARVIAGEALGVSAKIDTRTPILYHHWTLKPGAIVEQPVPDGFGVFAYVFGGELVCGPEKRSARDGQMVVFGDGNAVSMSVSPDADSPAELLLLGGVPLNEPVARYGPFVMNTEEEIHQAFADFRSGKMGGIRNQ